MSKGIAHVTLVGNLTRDPELRQAGGSSVCQLGVAVNSSTKNQAGSWTDKPNFFDVIVWGAQGENCAKFLAKGRQVAIDGRLDQRSWEAQDGTKRSKVEIIAETVMFIGGQPEQRTNGHKHDDRGYPQDDYSDVDFGNDDIPF
jgi:single-strand DNA-binding protein